MSSPFDRTVRYGRDGELWIREGSLGDRWVDTPNPLLEQTRMYWGRGLNPEDIERVVQRADCGFMRDLTDLTAEATRVDGHFSMCDSKRVRAASAIKPQVVPATGIGIDEKRAAIYADVVRQQLAWIPAQRQVLRRLAFGLKHGRAAGEKVWRENPAASAQAGGISDERSVKWRIDRVNWIHVRRLAFGPERELRVRDDMWGGYGFEARGLSLKDYPYKFIAFTPQRFDEYPEREGYGVRGLYWAFFKRFGTREELILLEQYGRPSRTIGVEEGATLQKEQLEEAAKAIDEYGANATGVRPPGTKIDTTQPVQGAGQVHQNVKRDANDEVSKLILGEVRTSEAKPGALGSSAEEVAQEVQDDVKSDDAADLSDLLTEQFAADVIALNFGAEALDHCPRIELPYERPPSRDQRIERTSKVWSMGIPLKEDEVYEEVGFTKPAPGDAVIKQAPQPAGPFGAPPAPGSTEPGTAPGATGGDASPLGDGGTGTKELDDQQTLSSGPPTFESYARAAHILELASYATQGARVVRYRVPKAAEKPTP
jgi:phage gp29-like protein